MGAAAGAKPCEAAGRAFRAERKPLPPTLASSQEGAYFARSAARFCLLVFSR